jgi:predicted house-cleaning noncanonical NTP pyrophosphatase (MazG superfamily)
MWASQYSSRTHFEWVWNGQAISVVQADKEEPPAGTKPRDLLPQEVPAVQVASLRVFRPADDSDYRAYRKLANARLYAELGYNMPEFFVLDDVATVEDLFNGIVGTDLDHDLAELTKRPLVIRTDGSKIPEERYEMLPRTEDLRFAVAAKAWLTGEFVRTIRDAKLTEASLCLIAHHFIPSVAAAWARAEPNSRMVRIESLWGLPEGVCWLAHDTFEVDTGDAQMEADRLKALRRYSLGEHLRFKGTFVASDRTGKWIPHQTRRPHDWGRSVSKRSWLFEIAHTTRRIAERQQHPVAVMWFVDNHPQATVHRVLPWFHQKSELSGSPNPAPRNRRRGATNFTITTRESWQELQDKVTAGSRFERVVVQPSDPELIRNRSFTEGLARLAAAKNFVVVLSGGILSHAYYVLQREGAQVECVDLYGTSEEVIEFNKLVRDRVPDLIRRGGESVTTVELRGDALIAALRRKLVEEAYEALDAPSGGELIGELADVLEVIRAISQHLHVTPAELHAERVEKYKKRGGFRDGLMLKTTATQHSLRPSKGGQRLPGLDALLPNHGREIITAVADLPNTGFYRRPDLRQLDQTTVEKLLTFETSAAELPSSKPISQTFSFTLPVEQSGEREFVVTIELQRDRSTLRGVIRLRPNGGRTAPDTLDDSQFLLEFDEPLGGSSTS